MEYWDEKSLEYKYQMIQVFEKLPEFIQKIVEKLFNNNVLSLLEYIENKVNNKQTLPL